MNVDMVYPPRPGRRGRVIAPYSGAGASQWCYLAETLGGGFELLAPEYFGCERPWTGEHAFTLAGEAARAIALIDESDPTPASAYRALKFPVLILRGEHAPMPTRAIAEGLSELLPNSRLSGRRLPDWRRAWWLQR